MAELTKEELENRPFNVDEAAQFLRIGKTTLFKLLRSGKLPAKKIGRQWRISRLALENYLAEDEGVQK